MAINSVIEPTEIVFFFLSRVRNCKFEITEQVLLIRCDWDVNFFLFDNFGL